MKDIVEVKNAIRLYSSLETFDIYSLESLCLAHGVLMKNLVDQPGKLRATSVGIIKGSQTAHIAPPGSMVYPLLSELFDYLKEDEEILLIKSCVFHYEFEFIHPFLDGNGRMGRFWQTLILKEYSAVFEFLPIETLIKERQREYYNVLSLCDKTGSSTKFIEFMLAIIKVSLEHLLNSQNISLTDIERLLHFKKEVGQNKFSRKDYLRYNKDISNATASRDLKRGTDLGILSRTGEKRLTQYQFINT